MTRHQWYLQLLASARESYDLGDCTLGEYERGTLALVRAYEQQQRARRERAARVRQQRREEATCT